MGRDLGALGPSTVLRNDLDHHISLGFQISNITHNRLLDGFIIAKRTVMID